MKTVVNATHARSQLYTLLHQVVESHEPIRITSKTGDAVLLAEEDWRAITETLYLLSIPGMRESIVEGMHTPPEECFEDPGW